MIRPYMHLGMQLACIVQSPSFDPQKIRCGRYIANDGRSAIATKLPQDRLAAFATIFVGFQRVALKRERSSWDADDHGERRSSLSLAVLAVTYRRCNGISIAGVSHAAAEAPSFDFGHCLLHTHYVIDRIQTFSTLSTESCRSWTRSKYLLQFLRTGRGPALPATGGCLTPRPFRA